MPHLRLSRKVDIRNAGSIALLPKDDEGAYCCDEGGFLTHGRLLRT